ncbi:cilia- and flagella-associated protein HOATZ isoform X1 [Mixophyes fleayi]|uniref:cilia- and flagella-associated protein HOATZ isoform X1 n=1 Tax=Mixophyes fleayi TaxID=3061075 RepID=UPI003F4DC36D
MVIDSAASGHYDNTDFLHKQPGMEGTEELDGDLTVFTGSCERDVMFSKIFWNSVTLQPPLESRLVSGNMQQRLRAAGDPTLRKTYTQQHLDDLKTECFLLEAQRAQDIEQRAIYLQKAKRREEIIALLRKQREDRVKKELVSLGYKPIIPVKEPRLSTHDIEEMEDIRAVNQLE